MLFAEVSDENEHSNTGKYEKVGELQQPCARTATYNRRVVYSISADTSWDLSIPLRDDLIAFANFFVLLNRLLGYDLAIVDFLRARAISDTRIAIIALPIFLSTLADTHFNYSLK